HSNPSAFNVYAHVRQCVLERRRHLGPQGTGSKLCGQSALDSESDEEEEEMQEPPAKLPKIVSMGLCGVFELIRETCASQPALCARSLHALLNMLQGLLPEELQSEPSDVLGEYLTLMLSSNPSSTPGSGHSLGSLACACLFSLVVAWGDTGKILKAISAILTHNGSFCSQHIMVPAILVSLQRSVQAALVGRAQIQDWFGAGVQRRALFQRWQLREVIVEADCPCLLQSDGTHLYFLTRRGLYRVGSGYGGTVRVRMHRRHWFSGCLSVSVC
uniref:Uncharacterized protein n=1 Tax=Eptatretus burgeri TaxID=7764 RepID=A0A8C4Q9Q7_EPTBU